MAGRVRPPRPTARLALCYLILLQSCTLFPAPTQIVQHTGAQFGAKSGANSGAPACPHIPPAPTAKPPPLVSGLPQLLQPGHWQWDDGAYVWTRPEWHARLSGTPAQWRDGYWEPNGGACVWHNGHFVPAGTQLHPPQK